MLALARESCSMRIASIVSPAELGLSSTLRRASMFSGTPPKPRASIRRAQTLLSFCHGTNSAGPIWTWSSSWSGTVSWRLDGVGLGDFFALQPRLRSSMFRKSVLPAQLSW